MENIFNIIAQRSKTKVHLDKDSILEECRQLENVVKYLEGNQLIKEINSPPKSSVHVNSDEKNKTDLEINKEVEKKTASS